MAQIDALEEPLRPKEGTAISMLAWARQPPAAPGHRARARIVEQLACLRAVGLKPAVAESVHPERLRQLVREGARFTAQHLRTLSPLRCRTTLAATVLDTATRLTDDGVALFDRAVGRMFRRAEACEEEAMLRDARAVNDKVRLLAKLGTALRPKRAAPRTVGALECAPIRLETHLASWPTPPSPPQSDVSFGWSTPTSIPASVRARLQSAS